MAELKRLAQMGEADSAAYRKMLAAAKGRDRLSAAEPPLPAQATNLRPAFTSAPALEIPPPVARERQLPRVENSNRFAAAPFLPDDAITIDGKLDDWKDLAPTEAGRKPRRQECRHGQSSISKGLGRLDHARPADCRGRNRYHGQDRERAARRRVLDERRGRSPYRHTQHEVLETRRGKYASVFCFPLWAQGPPEERRLRDASPQRRGGGWQMGASRLWARGHSPCRRADETGMVDGDAHSQIDLRSSEIKPGHIIGFNLIVDTGSDTYHHFTVKKKSSPSQHPETWGDLLLLGTDATVELLDETGQKLTAVCPGQAFRLRITDPDMNDDATRPDKIGAIIRCESGERETLVLEETGPNTGVFETTIASRLNTGGRVPNVLGVFEGERVTVEYIDQARAFGERGTVLRTTIPVSSLGKRIGK